MNIVKRYLFSILIITLVPLVSFSQGNTKKDELKGWYHLDKTQGQYFGISLDKAYQFVKGKKSKEVIVAVLDNGIDTLHEDLKQVLWRNPKEIPGNGIDDDRNGYVDDIFGWNFIGGKDGRNVHEDTDEGVRVYHRFKAKYGDTVPDPSKAKTPEEKAEIEMYRKAKEQVTAIDPAEILFIKRILPSLKRGDSIIKKELNKTEYTCEDLKNYFPTDIYASNTKSIHLGTCKVNNNNNDITNKDVLGLYEKQIKKAEAVDNPPKDFRGEIVKDDESDINDRFYGNNDVMAGAPFHGTHTSGIIAASRNNGRGMDGVADNVKIMTVRMLGDADEHDKDIALGIRYAVDNGAQIINMSFGKNFSPEKKWVDDAVKYAESKGVLIVHAAGNDAKNIDLGDNFPNAVYFNNTGKSETFITVGASSDPKIIQTTKGGEEIKDYVATFSNYGKKEVDVFAPGVEIYSTTPANDYKNYDGTSMAAPVVAGIAALILQYYPDLSAQQVKYVIEKSSTPLLEKVTIPGSDKKVPLSEISKTGGIVNAYEAIKLASTLKGERNKPPVLIKPKIVKKKKG